MSTTPAHTLDVRDFGAKGDGVANDLPALAAAVESARALDGPVTIRVPDGEYRLQIAEGAEAKAHLYLKDLTDVTLAADNLALFVAASPYHEAVRIVGSTRVTVRNIAVDFEQLPFTQGMVEAVSPADRTIDMRLEPGFPAPTLPHLDAYAHAKPFKQVGYIFDPQTGKKLNQYSDQYLRSRVQDLGDGLYRYRSDNPVELEMVGTRFAVIGRRKASAFLVHKSEDIRLLGCEVYSAPSTGFHVSNSSNTLIDRCVIKQKPGTTRVMSTNADGLHEKWTRVGSTLSNSYFTGMGDDAVNIGGSYTAVYAVLDPRTIIVQSHGSIEVDPAELVVVDLTTHDHVPLGPLLSVERVKSPPGYKKPGMKLTFANVLPPLVTMGEAGDTGAYSRVLNLNACGRGAQVINNHFYNHRVRGVLMRAPDAVIRGNHFDTLAGPGVVISNDGGFLTEGPSGNGTIVADNTFTRIERSNICVFSSIRPNGAAATRGVVGLKITGNRFIDYGGPNIYGRGYAGNVFMISNADDIVISGNEIGSPAPDSPQAPPVVLTNDGHIDWRDNTIAGRPLDPARDFGDPPPKK